MKHCILTLFSILILVSCSSKQDPIQDLEALSRDLSENCETYSQSDWENVAIRYSNIENELQKYEYTDEELKQIGKLKAKCVKAIVHSSGNIIKSQIHNVKMQLEGASEELESAFGEIDKILNDN